MNSNKIQLEDRVPTDTGSNPKKKKSMLLVTLIVAICTLIVVIIFLISVPSGNSGKLGKDHLPDKQITNNIASEKQTSLDQTKAKTNNFNSGSNQTIVARNNEDDKLTQALALVQQGDQYMGKGDPEKALSKYKDALQLTPKNIQIMNKIVAATDTRDEKKQTLQKQEAQYQVANDTTKVTTLIQQGDQYVINSDPEKALEKYNEALYLDPSNKHIQDKIITAVLQLVQQGDQYMASSDPEKALQKYNKALQITPGSNRIQDKIVAATNV